MPFDAPYTTKGSRSCGQVERMGLSLLGLLYSEQYRTKCFLPPTHTYTFYRETSNETCICSLLRDTAQQRDSTEQQVSVSLVLKYNAYDMHLFETSTITSTNTDMSNPLHITLLTGEGYRCGAPKNRFQRNWSGNKVYAAITVYIYI